MSDDHADAKRMENTENAWKTFREACTLAEVARANNALTKAVAEFILKLDDAGDN